uniref:Putative secreted protein n=1 Tax=Ixodes ricinus TaxID=34613 RepID=A0A6B0UR74_IXORI
MVARAWHLAPSLSSSDALLDSALAARCFSSANPDSRSEHSPRLECSSLVSNCTFSASWLASLAYSSSLAFDFSSSLSRVALVASAAERDSLMRFRSSSSLCSRDRLKVWLSSRSLQNFSSFCCSPMAACS